MSEADSQHIIIDGPAAVIAYGPNAFCVDEVKWGVRAPRLALFGFLSLGSYLKLTRACGERWQHPYRSGRKYGLSPRLRGTEEPEQCPQDQWRFIPAPAGNGSSFSEARASMAVYPRACGERSIPVSTEATASGLSPRLRGTVSRDQQRFLSCRFIPAPAGNG